MEFEEFLSTYMSEINSEFLKSRSSDQQALFTEVYGLIRQYFPQCDCYTTHNAKEKKRFFKFGVKDRNGKGKPRISVSFFADTLRVSVNRHFFKERKIIEPSSIEELSPFLENIKDQLNGEMDGAQRNPKDYSGDEEATEQDTTEQQFINDSCEYDDSLCPLNQILYGPPGTGKTYHTIEAAVRAAEPEKYKALKRNPAMSTAKTQREEITKLFKSLVDDDRIRFVTFHQSYGYEEFVEGLSAKTENEQLSYYKKDGIFKEICNVATKQVDLDTDSLINPKGNVWKISIESTNKNPAKTYSYENDIAVIGWSDTGDLSTGERNDYFNGLGSNNQNSLTSFTQEADVGDLILCINSKSSIEAIGVITGDYFFNERGVPTRPDFCHQIPVKWLAKDLSIDLKSLNDSKNFHIPTFCLLSRFNVNNTLSYLLEQGINVETAHRVKQADNYVLIIDEINRGNISKIFGELITLIEPSKRSGKHEALEVRLPYSGEKFSVPENLYIIGTMNTADRSLAMMDTALRRRFDFVEMMPQPELFKDKVVKGINLEQLLKTMNKRIEVLYDREHTLGHAFLIPVLDALNSEDSSEEKAFGELKNTFKNKIIPLLEEYFFEDWNKIRLVLGDNRKEKSELKQYIFVESKSEEYNHIFGENHGLETYEDTKTTYTLADFNAEGSVWNSPKAYQAIYDDTLLKRPANISDDAGEVIPLSAQ